MRDYFCALQLKSSLRTRALRGASVTLVTQIVNFGIGTIGTIILARLLTPDDFGLVTMVLAFSLLLQNFGLNGFTEAIIQREKIDHRQISTLFWINAGLSLLLALFFIALTPFIIWFYKEPRLKTIILAISASIMLAGLSTQHLALLLRNMQFYKTSGNELLATITSLTTAIYLAYRGWGYWALVAKWVISPLAITIGAWILSGWRPGLPARNSGVKPLISYALHTYASFIMNYFRRNLDRMIVGRFFGSQPLGYYDRAYHLSAMLPTQMLTPINNVALATFSRLSNDTEKYRQSFLEVLSIFSFVVMPLSAALTITGEDLILFLLGPQWHEAGRIFTAFGFSIGFVTLYGTHGWLHLSLGTPDRWLRWGIISFIFTALLFVIGLPFGPLGLAAAYSASFLIMLGPSLWYAGRPIHLKVSSVWSAIWKSTASAFTAGLLTWLALHSHGPTSRNFLELGVLSRILVSVTICVLFYLVLIIALHRSFKPIMRFILVVREMITYMSGVKLRS